MNNREVYGYGEDGRVGLKNCSCLRMLMVRCGWVGGLEKICFAYVCLHTEGVAVGSGVMLCLRNIFCPTIVYIRYNARWYFIS